MFILYYRQLLSFAAAGCYWFFRLCNGAGIHLSGQPRNTSDIFIIDRELPKGDSAYTPRSLK